MSAPILTICIPTYKRSANLEILLRNLLDEIAPVADDIVVHVADNCSPDDTPHVLDRLKQGWPALEVHRHETNVGPDNNFAHCVRTASTRWCWLIGDDDLPKRGVIPQLVALLRQYEPAMLYMQSEWIAPVLNPDQGTPVGKLTAEIMGAEAFADAVHVWFTFISGVIIDRVRLQTALQGHPIDRFNGTNLIQLGWALPLLNSDGPFVHVRERCILATKDNSGGYGLLTVFGVDLARIVNDSFGSGSPIARALIGATTARFLPQLIWGGRLNPAPHLRENPWPAMNRLLGSQVLYWMLLVPLGRFPKPLARPFFFGWRVTMRLQREWRERVSVALHRSTAE
jgi:abequosyltransferase